VGISRREARQSKTHAHPFPIQTSFSCFFFSTFFSFFVLFFPLCMWVSADVRHANPRHMHTLFKFKSPFPVSFSFSFSLPCYFFFSFVGGYQLTRSEPTQDTYTPFSYSDFLLLFPFLFLFLFLFRFFHKRVSAEAKHANSRHMHTLSKFKFCFSFPFFFVGGYLPTCSTSTQSTCTPYSNPQKNKT